MSKKFQIKPEMRGGVFRSPKDVFLPFPALKKMSGKDLDYVIVFVFTIAEIQKHAAKVYTLLMEDGIFWICYPKLSGSIKSDITRDRGWETIKELGLAGCRQIAINETWSALRFRAPQFSKKK